MARRRVHGLSIAARRGRRRAAARTRAVALLHPRARRRRRTAAPATRVAVLVGPVTCRPRSTDRSSSSRWRRIGSTIDEFNRWAAPLSDAIARTVAGDLAVLLGTPDVAAAPLANFRAGLPGDDQRPALRLAARPVRADRRGVGRAPDRQAAHAAPGRTIARETVQGDGFDALAAAHSRALAPVSGDIAAAIRRPRRLHTERRCRTSADPLHRRLLERRHTACWWRSWSPSPCGR